MELLQGLDKKEVVQKLDRNLFKALEGYGITLRDKWIAIIDSIENSIRIADEAMPNTEESKPNLERALTLAGRLLIDIEEVASDLRRSGKRNTDIECQTFAANTATSITVLLDIFRAYGVGEDFEKRIRFQFTIPPEAAFTFTDIQENIVESFRPRQTLPIASSSITSDEYLRVIQGGASRDSVPYVSNGIPTDGNGVTEEKTNPFGINIADVGAGEEETDDKDDEFDEKEPTTQRGGIRKVPSTDTPGTVSSVPPASNRELPDLDDDEYNDTTQVTGAPVQMVGEYDAESDSSYPPSGIQDDNGEEDLAETQEQPATPSPSTERGMGGYSLTGDDIEQDDSPIVEVSGPDPRVPRSDRPEPIAIPIEDDRGTERSDEDITPKNDQEITSISEPPPELVAKSIPPEAPTAESEPPGDESPADPIVESESPNSDEGPEVTVGPGIRRFKSIKPKAVSEPPAPVAESEPPAAPESVPPAEDTAPFSTELIAGSVFPKGKSIVPSQPPPVTEHKMDSAPSVAATETPAPEPQTVTPKPESTPAPVSKPVLSTPIPGAPTPYREPAATTENETVNTKAQDKEEPKEEAANETPIPSEPEPDSTKTPPESTPEVTKSTRSKIWTALAAVAGVTVAGGAIYGGYSAYNNSQRETHTVAVNSANTATTTATPPPTKPASTAVTSSGKSEIAPEKTAHRRTYRIDTLHPDFQRYMKSLGKADGVITAAKKIALNLNVELNGVETPFEKQEKTYAAFLARGIENHKKIQGIFQNWKTIFERFQKETKGMNDEQKIKHLDKVDFKHIRPHLLFANNRIETTPPKGVSGYTVEMDPQKNHAMEVFLVKYRVQAPYLFKTINEVYNEIAQKPLKAGRYQEVAAEFIERCKDKARAKIAANPKVKDGSLYVLGQIEQYFLQKGRDHIILEPLRTLNPIISKDSSVKPSKINNTIHPTTPSPSHTQINPFGTMQDVDALEGGWELPDSVEPQIVVQNSSEDDDMRLAPVIPLPKKPRVAKSAPALSSLRSLSAANRPQTQQPKRMTGGLSAQVKAQNRDMKLAPTIPLPQKPTTPTTPKQTVRQKIAGIAGKAGSFVKGLFSSTPATPAQKEQRNLRAEIPKKSFLKNLFG